MRGGGNVNIDYLHYFLDVAQTKSITRAAKLNFISPQGMSRAMNELEKELGCDLLIRYSNKLSLSPVGEELVPKIAGIVNDYTKLLDFASLKAQSRDASCDYVQLECQNIAMLCFFPQEAKDYIFESGKVQFREAANPQIRHTLLSRCSSEDATSRPVVGLMCFFNQERNPETEEGGIGSLEDLGYRYHPYLKTYDKVMVPLDSPLAEKDILSDEDIAANTLVATNTHLHTVLSRRFGVDAIGLASPNFTLRKRMVEKGVALSFLPAIAELTVADPNSFVLRDMERPYEVEIGFVGMESDFEAEPFVELMTTLDSFYRSHLDSGLFALCD
ncbi:MAG: LysR family transcriptional regulator [Eggerthellaceae bacterium]|nr:LysR family transcriptional regulator [Eggerthellaceae bacterium]